MCMYIGWISYTRYWSLSFLSCMRSGFKLFISLSISRLSVACRFKSSSNFLLLSWISVTLDFSFSELFWILKRVKSFPLIAARIQMRGITRHICSMKNKTTSQSPCRFLLCETSQCSLCWGAPGSRTAPQRSWWSRWRLQWRFASSATPERGNKRTSPLVSV